jgi:hypothetical protein
MYLDVELQHCMQLNNPEEPQETKIFETKCILNYFQTRPQAKTKLRAVEMECKALHLVFKGN